MSSLTAEVTDSETWGSAVYYNIRVRRNGELVQLQTARRFSEFIYLNDSLFPDTEFPVPKRWFGFSYAVVDERTAGLQDYLNRTLERFGDNPPMVLKVFLGLENHPSFWDLDGDGRVSTNEVITVLSQKTCFSWCFGSCCQDLDGDGIVETDEVLTLCGRMRLCMRVGCLNKDGPAMWQLARNPFPQTGVVAPERYLEATGECFILMCLVSWLLTSIYNPAIIEKNLLKDRVGYNNICVGFDTPPARYVAMPLQVLQAFLAVRYVSLDTTRAELEKAAGRIGGKQYAFTRVANLCYGCFMCCFPILLVLTPTVDVNLHTYLFFAMIIFSFTVVAANFAESQRVTLPSKIWLCVFGAFTVLLPAIGVMDFANYDRWESGDPPCKDGTDSCWTMVEFNISSALGTQLIETKVGTAQTPPVPWQLLWVLDWGWFILLGMTVIFLPDSPPLKVTFELDTRSVEETEKVEEEEMPDVFELIGATWTFLIRPQLNFRNFCGVVCAFFIGWNLTKLPYYWPYGETAPAMTDVTYDPALCEAEAPPTQCYGLEFQANLAAWMPGYRAYKLVTDPNLFLAPHVAMGSCLLGLLALVLFGWKSEAELGRSFFLLAFVFGLHIVPVEGGFPTRKSPSAHINGHLVALIWLLCACGGLGLLLRKAATDTTRHRGDCLLHAAWVGVGCCLVTAPLGEWATIASAFANAREEGGVFTSPDGDVPLPQSGHDLYARMECPAIGWLVTFSLLFLGAYKAGGMLFNRLAGLMAAANEQIDAETRPPPPFNSYASQIDGFMDPPVPKARSSKFDLDGDGEVDAAEIATLFGRLRLCVRVGCLNKDGPAMWQLARNPFPQTGVVAPERYLEATGECFILMCLVSWLLTSIYNPAIIEKNLLKDRVGYNNICVGFDTPPARYVAMPLQVLQAFLAVRYVSLDTTRAELEKAAGRIGGKQYAFTRVANLCYGCFMCCFPILLVLTPTVDVNLHTYLFFAMIIFSFTVVAANFAESQKVTCASRLWLCVFAAHTVLLPATGVLDFANYDRWESGDPMCKDGTDSCWEWGVTELDTPYGAMMINTTVGTAQTPPVPWQLLWYLDWGWFILLGMTVIFLPDSPPLKVRFELDTDFVGVDEMSERDPTLVRATMTTQSTSGAAQML